MSENEIDELGPVDYLVVEFPAGKSSFNGEMAEELTAVVDKGIIRILDLLVLQKDEDGNVEGIEIDDVENLDELRGLETHVAEVLAADDVVHLAEAMEMAARPGCSSGRTSGRRRSPRRLVEPAGSWSRAGGSRSRRSSPRSRRRKQT